MPVRLSGNPGRFKIGPVELDVAPEDIQISRHENHQFIRYLRQAHSMKVSSGRTAVRVDIGFSLLIDQRMNDIEKLQQLVAMTKVTPFVPVENQYLANHLPLFSDHDLIKSENNTTGTSIPMAIFGLSMTAGADSAEKIDCRMSFLFWNPEPFTGLEGFAWNNEGSLRIATDFSTYIRDVINITPQPFQEKDCIVRWFNIQPYRDLLDRYGLTQPLPAVIRDEEDEVDIEQDYTRDFELEVQRASEELRQQGINAVWDAIASAEGIPDTPLERRVTSQFGNRHHPVDGVHKQHKGTDFLAPEGTLIVAVKPGRILSIRPDPSGYGNQIIIRHDNGLLTRYAHLSKVQVDRGQVVGQGQLIGRSGSTGKVTGAHLHFETIDDRTGELLDPEDILAQDGFVNPVSSYDELAARAAEQFNLATDQDLVDQLIRRYFKTQRPDDTGGLERALRDRRQLRIIQDQGLREYLGRVFGINTPLGPTKRADSVLVDSQGERIPKITPLVDPENERKLNGLGWHRINDDGRVVNPLFKHTGSPNEIDMTPRGGPADRPQQVVTSISVSFQNRLALMPVSGWPYPAMQHMGSMDSDIRVSCAVINNRDDFSIVRDLQSMAHTMDARALRHRGNIWSPADIFSITEMELENKFVNALGLRYFILTDLDVVRDPESAEVVRVDLSLTENPLDPAAEELQGHTVFSDSTYKAALRQWLLNDQGWRSDPDMTSKLREVASKVKALYDTAVRSHQINARGLDPSTKAEWIQNELTKIQDPWPHRFNRNIIFEGAGSSYADPDHPEHERFGLATFPYIAMKSAPPATTIPGVYLDFFNRTDIKDLQSPTVYPVPYRWNDILRESIFDTFSDAIKFWFGGSAVGEIEFPQGQARMYLNTKHGPAMIQMAERLKQLHSDQNGFMSLNSAEPVHALLLEERLSEVRLWLTVWNDAHLDWYVENVIDPILYNMSRSFPDYFRNITEEFSREHQRHPGCYRDLGIANDLDRNPYEWMDIDLSEQIKARTEQLYQTAITYSKDVVDSARRAAHPDAGDPLHDVTVQRLQNWNDSPQTQETVETIDAQYQRGVDNYLTGAGSSIESALGALRNVEPAQFTVRRAFPTFKFFIVEEDNRGVVKTFDEFYSYNAVIEWNLIEYQSRPGTLVVTVSNLFNHLDAVILDEKLGAEDLEKLGLAGRQGGIIPSRQVSRNRVDQEVLADGTVTELRNIMLKPGAKVVMKAGYDNDPARLETVFAGQVTEVHPGDVMTIVCQDWASELLGSWDPQVRNPTDIGLITRLITNKEEDVTGTAGTTMMMKALLSHAQCRHFGHWQIGAANPFAIYSSSYLEQDTQRQLINQGIPAGDRSMTNVRPSLNPFFSAFGRNPEVAEVNVENRSIWEIILELSLRHPNDMVMVRPFGQGDATLYFGPPHGFYTTKDLVDQRGQYNDSAVEELMFNAFMLLIQRGAAIRLNDIAFNEDRGTISYDSDDGPVDRLFGALDAFFSGDTGITAQPIPLWAVLSHPEIATFLFKNTGKGSGHYIDRIAQHGGGIREQGGRTNPLGAGPRLTLNTRILNPTATREVVRIWFDALQDNRYVGIPFGADGLFNISLQRNADILNYVRRLIDQAILLDIMDQARQLGPDEQDDRAIALRQLTDLVKPVRSWHIVTSKHHIIANNIQVNSDYANRIVIGDTEVRYDPGLDDVRTRYYNQFDSDDVPEPVKGFMAVNLLRDEMKRMYTGEIILTGNAAIRPYDVLVIVDQVRQIYGIVEVRKVQHSMNMDFGYITIVTPGLICEAGDMTIAHAYQSFYSALADDLEKLQDQGAIGKVLASVKAFQFAPSTLGNVDKFRSRSSEGSDGKALAAGGAAAGVGLGAAGAYGTVAATAAGTGFGLPVAALLGGGALLYAGFTYFSMHNNALKDHIKTHPITITPLVKRGWPWIGGIDGAQGRTIVGQWGLNKVEGWRDFGKMLDAVKRVQTTFSVAAGQDLEFNPLSKTSLDEFSEGNLPTVP